MKFAIVVTTYYRADGKTKNYLMNTLRCVKEQTHQDYVVYLIGDKYSNEDEFYECARVLDNNKIVAINLPYAKERDKYSEQPRVLHHAGGCNARNVGIEIALLSGYDFIVNLDHDDRWEPDHLERINDVLELHPDAVFVCTRATHIPNHPVLPVLTDPGIIQQFLPKGCGTIHSSTCVNFRKIPLRYKNSMEEYGTIEPSDALMWNDMAQFMRENNLNGFVYNKLTCYHDTEGEAFK